MYLRSLVVLCLLIAITAQAQTIVSRGSNLSVDATEDGRIALDLLGDLWVVPGGGGEARQLTHNLKSVQRPRWSPDGDRLVYSAIIDGSQGIWVYDIENAIANELASLSNLDVSPDWHPDGERLVFSSDRSGAGYDIWEIDLETGLSWRTTDRIGDETDAAWSADGRDLVYVHHNEGLWSLVLRRHAMPEEILLTSPDELTAPSWRPDKSLITFFRHGSAGFTTIDMAILSEPRLVRTYASNEQFVPTPVSWLDRHRMIYSANGEIRIRDFNSWSSRPVRFRATILPVVQARDSRERPLLAWPDEPDSKLVIRAARYFDGVGENYQYDKDIVIEGGRITAIDEQGDRSGYIVIDMGDLTLIPGLIDADARLPADVGIGHGPDLLTTGVTTVAARHGDGTDLNNLWAGKNVPGPRLLSGDEWQIGATPRPEVDATAAVVTSRLAGLPTGSSLPALFHAMQVAGLTPVQTLRGMGVNAAAALLADPFLGRIATGAAADLVFIDGDPLQDIMETLNVVAVVRNGRFHSVSGLIDRAKSAELTESVE